jgi:oxygen-dependent protoporphyrinogen oxidase
VSDQKRIAIMGGGVSGLAAALRLYELMPEADVTLYESADRLGGVIRSERLDGFLLEHGPDSLLTQVPWGLDLCKRVGLGDEILPTASEPQGVYVVCRGRLRKVPDGLALMAPQRLWPLVMSPILSVRGKLRLAAEYFVPPRQDTSEESLAAFATRRLGQEVFERLVQPLVSGIYMGSPDTLSVQATFPRFVEMEAKHGGLIRAARAARGQGSGFRGQGAGISVRESTPESRGHQSAIRNPQPALPNPHSAARPGGPAYGMFVAPRQGMEQIARAIAERLPSDSIRLRTIVLKVCPIDQGRWKLVTRSPDSEPVSETFDAVIVAAPAFAAAKLLAGAAPALAAEMAAIDYLSCVVVNLAFAREQIRHPLSAFGFVTPLIERRHVTACTFSSIKYPGRAPEGACLLRAYLGGAANPAVIDRTDYEIRKAALADLNDLLKIRGAPAFATVQRQRQAMPQYTLGHLARVDRIERLAARLPGFALAGNAFRGGGVAHCIHSGEMAAEQIAGQLQDQPLQEMAGS